MPDLAPIKPDALANIFIKKDNSILGQKSEGDENTNCLKLKAFVNNKIVPIKRVVKITKNGAVQNVSKRLVEIYNYNKYNNIVQPGSDPQDLSTDKLKMWVGWIPYESGNTYGDPDALACGSGGTTKGDYAFGQYQFDVGQGDFFSETNRWAFIPFSYTHYPTEFSGFQEYLSYNKEKFWANNAKEPLKQLFRNYAYNYTEKFLWCQNQVFTHIYLDPVINYCSSNGITNTYLYNPYILGTLASMAVRQGTSFVHGNARMYNMFQSLKNSVNNNTDIRTTLNNMYLAFGDTKYNWTGATMDYTDRGRWTENSYSYGGTNQKDKCLQDFSSDTNCADLSSTVIINTSSEVLSFINSPIIASTPEDFNYYSVDPDINFYITLTFRFKRTESFNSDINIVSNLSSLERAGYRLYIDKDNVLCFELISKNGLVYKKIFTTLDEDTNTTVDANSGKWYNFTIEKRKNGPVIKIGNGIVFSGEGKEILNNKEFWFSNKGDRQFKFGDVDENQNSIVSFKDKIIFCGSDQSGLVEDLCTFDFSTATLNNGVLYSSTV